MARAIEDRNQRRAVVEQRQDRLELAREAGFGAVSAVGVAAGVTSALGAAAVALGTGATALNVVGVDTGTMNDGDWRNLGVVVAAVGVVALLGAFLFGGYVAGRMARRAGAIHGVLVGGIALVTLGVALGVAHLQDATVAVVDRLDALGAPTAGAEWAGIGSVVAVATVVAMVGGGLLGGVRGERWHQRLADRALDPSVGPEADLVKQQARLERAERRLARKREKAEHRGVLVPSRHTSGETPAVPGPAAAAGAKNETASENEREKDDEGSEPETPSAAADPAAATTEPDPERPEPAEPGRDSQSVAL